MASKSSFSWRDYLWHLRVFLKPQRTRLLLISGMLTLQLAYALLFPLGLQQIFDHAIPQRDFSLLVLVIGGLFVGFLISSAASLMQEYTAAHIGSGVLQDLRLQMFQQLQKLSAAFYQRNPKGELLSRFSNDLHAIEYTIVRGFTMCVFNLLLLASSIILLFVVDWRLATITLIASPVLLSGPNLFGRSANQTSYKRKESEADLSNALQEQLAGHQVIRAYGLEEHIQRSFRDKVIIWKDRTVKMNFFASLTGITSYIAVLLIILLIIAIGAYWAIQGTFSIGALVAFVGLLLNVDEATRGLNQFLPTALQSLSGMERVQELLQENEAPLEDEGALEQIPPFGEIRFQDVTFGFTEKEDTLKKLSFSIKTGQSVAFIGPSGSGKSTVLKLLTRSFAPQKGSINLGDTNIRSIQQHRLQSLFGVVFQHTFLFNTTIRENIRQGNLEATDQEVEDAAKAAELHGFIAALPSGYETEVGEEGGFLSGGQRQRVAIARMLLRNPPILVLDEATSALDPVTEIAINKTLEKLTKGRTVISVTHRLSAVSGHDALFVMEKGHLVEHGPFETLLANEGLFSQMWKKQSGITFSAHGYAKIDAERLQELPLLTALPLAKLEIIARRFETEHFGQDEVIIQQGELGKKFYILIRGTAEVLLEQGDALSQSLSSLEIGDYFGEIALLENVHTTATVKAKRACTCLSLTRNQFHNLLREMPGLKEDIEPLMRQRYQDTTQHTNIQSAAEQPIGE